jgi:hypothetical protein
VVLSGDVADDLFAGDPAGRALVTPAGRVVEIAGVVKM